LARLRWWLAGSYGLGRFLFALGLSDCTTVGSGTQGMKIYIKIYIEDYIEIYIED
jgi:hypothetical protein